ncbi:MAG: LuxR C-terminal-related transcriptional regulator [Pseudonocardia sp.]|nr:LuxR C-terminal-related transcriptional regulator [Pseudonocardia sp.]
MLHGRAAERAAIATRLDEAWASRGGALVLRGQPGVGKSALLDDAVDRAEGMRVLRTQGVESESPLAFAALHRLLRPVLAHLGRLPARQARALRAAFGEGEDTDTDRFLVFLAALSLLAEASEDGPVLAVGDDAHWLDDASAAALLFVARRVQAERVAMLFAAREGDVRRFDSAEVPDLAVGGLDRTAAAALLAERAGMAVPVEVGEQLVTRTGGNPLALVELPAALSADELSGTAPLPAQLPVTEGIERVFLDRARRLPAPALTVLLVAAADDSGLVTTVRAAAAALGVDEQFLETAERSDLLRVRGRQVELRHPLVRSAIYTAATSSARRRVHHALATVTGEQDPDRRAWHLAAATEDPDETVARELDQVARRARHRGGQEAASAALERAAELTPQPGDPRATRLHQAAHAAWLAGAPPRARALAEAAHLHVEDPGLRADNARLRARVEWNTGSLQLGHRMVVLAAADVAPFDPDRARDLAMFAVALASFGGDSGAGIDPVDLVPPAGPADSPRVRCSDDLMRGLAHVPRGEWADATRHLRAAFSLADHLDADDQDLLPNLGIGALHLQDDDAVRRFHTMLLTRARDTGAMIMVLYALTRRVFAEIATGRWPAARADTAEALELARGTGQTGLTAMPLAWSALLAALCGDDPAEQLAAAEAVASEHPMGTLEGLVRDALHWTRALAAGDRSDVALRHLEQITFPAVGHLAAIDRTEAAVRAGRPDTAITWARELESFAEATGASWAAAAAAHGRALLARDRGDGGTAEQFEQALAHHARSGRRVDRARTELAYGEHLRRARRRVDARTHLRAALATFDELGATPWAERARQELRASGETARRGAHPGATDLTPQELQVARLVAEGMGNREVAGQLFVSPRTIDFHLRNVFTKLSISSRGELARVELAAP